MHVLRGAGLLSSGGNWKLLVLLCSAGGMCVSTSGPVFGRGASPEAAGAEAAVFHTQGGGQSDGLPSQFL